MKLIHNHSKTIDFSYESRGKRIYINQLFWLLIWLIIGSLLRFAYLDSKPLWSDEWATIVFSLGHSFHTVPLDRVISISTLLEPLRVDSTLNTNSAIANLMTESTHPPLYSVLGHWWLKLFSQQGDLVSIWLARSLSAILGVLAIPAIYALGWLVFDSLLAAQMAAALMAVSPYGVYLAQETRHYTLAIFWVVASLACFMAAVRCWKQRRVPSLMLILAWILINSLGIATHYFFGLNLLTQVMILGWLWWQDTKNPWSYKIGRGVSVSRIFWRRISLAIFGTIASCLVWVFRWQYFPDPRLTEWIRYKFSWNLDFFAPVGRLLTWILTMVVLPPVEGTPTWISVGAVAILLPLVGWLIKAGWQYIYTPLPLVAKTLVGFIGVAIMLVILFPYILRKDLTLAARFQYFYFPAIVLLIAGIISQRWHLKRGKMLAIAVLLASCLGGVTVISNYGFQKSDRPDLVVPAIVEAQQQQSNIPHIIATVHKTHEQTGEMLGLAWEWQKIQSSSNERQLTPPRFLLLHKENDASVATRNLYSYLNVLPRPFDLWLVNFSASDRLPYHTLNSQNCLADPDYRGKVSGYRYRMYHCQKKKRRRNVIYNYPELIRSVY